MKICDEASSKSDYGFIKGHIYQPVENQMFNKDLYLACRVSVSGKVVTRLVSLRDGNRWRDGEPDRSEWVDVTDRWCLKNIRY